MKIGWQGWVGIAAFAWIFLRATRPAWYNDLMLRAFAGDTGDNTTQIAGAADLAAKYLLPMGWVVRIAEVGTGVTLEQAIQKVQAQVLKMGPPADTEKATLAAYKEAAISAAKA